MRTINSPFFDFVLFIVIEFENKKGTYNHVEIIENSIVYTIEKI